LALCKVFVSLVSKRFSYLHFWRGTSDYIGNTPNTCFKKRTVPVRYYRIFMSSSVLTYVNNCSRGEERAEAHAWPWPLIFHCLDFRRRASDPPCALLPPRSPCLRTRTRTSSTHLPRRWECAHRTPLYLNRKPQRRQRPPPPAEATATATAPWPTTTTALILLPPPPVGHAIAMAETREIVLIINAVVIVAPPVPALDLALVRLHNIEAAAVPAIIIIIIVVVVIAEVTATTTTTIVVEAAAAAALAGAVVAARAARVFPRHRGYPRACLNLSYYPVASQQQHRLRLLISPHPSPPP
jgi:hypothetical protein